MKKKIKLFDPSVGSEEIRAITKVIKSHFWASGYGVGNVLKFEKKFRKFVNADSCIAVNNGTSALNLALSLSNIKNKEVIVPSLSFVSTAHAVLINGGIPIFVDVDPLTMCIDPENIKKAITKKTKIVLPVHFAGMPSNLSQIIKICEENNLNLVEDAAHAVGTTYGKKQIGKHGMACCFSFHPIKNLAMPNDFSKTQMKALELGYIDKKFWILPPEHLNYFNIDNFKKLMVEMNFHISELYSSFPIDFYIFHPGSNFITDKKNGKPAHRARINLELLMAKEGLENYYNLCKAFANCNVGRTITALIESK